jgi:hypothetical protein
MRRDGVIAANAVLDLTFKQKVSCHLPRPPTSRTQPVVSANPSVVTSITMSARKYAPLPYCSVVTTLGSLYYGPLLPVTALQNFHKQY